VSEYHINVFYSDEDGGYIADIPDLDACSAFGATAEEALTEVERAKEAWLSAAREAGQPIPEPRYRPRDLRPIDRLGRYRRHPLSFRAGVSRAASTRKRFAIGLLNPRVSPAIAEHRALEHSPGTGRFAGLFWTFRKLSF
jgi:predicted RNase H-like HicB family nuclease